MVASTGRLSQKVKASHGKGPGVVRGRGQQTVKTCMKPTSLNALSRASLFKKEGAKGGDVVSGP